MTDTPPQYTRREELEETFRRLGQQLERPAEAYLIGGGAMTLRGTKDSTKDIDLVTATNESYRRIEAALRDLGYELERDLARQYESLGATSVLRRDDGGHIDLFDRQVALKLSFSEGMQRRAEELPTEQPLVAYVCAPVDVALFKSMTPRAGDTADVRTIIAAHLGDGFDWGTFQQEFESQLPLNDGPRAYEWLDTDKPHPVVQMESTIRTLDSVPTDFARRVRGVAQITEAEKFTGRTLRHGGETRDSELVTAVAAQHPPTADAVREAVDALEEKGVVDRTDGRVSLSDRLQSR